MKNALKQEAAAPRHTTRHCRVTAGSNAAAPTLEVACKQRGHPVELTECVHCEAFESLTDNQGVLTVRCDPFPVW